MDNSIKFDVLMTEDDFYRLIDQMDDCFKRKIYIYLENKLYGEKLKGIDKVGRLWRARITQNKITTHLGYFKTKEEAINAYKNSIAK